jgi:YhcH/YjgK/YiaL family protein
MILDRLTNAEFYRNISPRLWQGLEYLRSAPLSELSLGRVEIDGDRLYANVQEYTTKLAAECQYEAHRKYCDIQVVASGSERIGWAHLAQMQELVTYNAEKDVAFFEGQGDLFTLSPGIFAIFFPHDVHMPCMQAAAPSVVRKIVVKVAID